MKTHSRKIAILQSNYVPWKGYFDLIHDVDTFIFYDIVKYTKNDWRNRNVIYTKNGKQWLSIPIESSAVNLRINEVEIKNSTWQDLHFKSLYLGYKKAPFFFQLEELITDYLKDKTWANLSELNQYLIRKISQNIGIVTEFKSASEFELPDDRVERLVSLTVQSGGNTYISGPAAKNYLSGKEVLFHNAGVELLFKEYSKYPEYKQLHEPFENAVSILDLIANLAWDDISEHIWTSN